MDGGHLLPAAPVRSITQALNEGDTGGSERFKTMERKLFNGIMTPGAVLSIVFGLWLWLGYGISGGWLHAKLTLVVLLVAYHALCWKHLRAFRDDRNARSERYFRIINELPSVLLFGIVILLSQAVLMTAVMTTPSKALVLFSGGQDSTTCLAWALSQSSHTSRPLVLTTVSDIVSRWMCG